MRDWKKLELNKGRVCKKIKYDTRIAAWTAALHYFQLLGAPSAAYSCKRCNKFHLTTKSPMQLPKKLLTPQDK